MNKVPPALEGYLTLDAVGELLGYTHRTIYRAMGEGTLRFTKINNVRYSRADWVQEHIELRARGGRDPASRTLSRQ